MITIAGCVRLGAKYGVAPEVIENDYVVELFLKAIADSPEVKRKIIFRGGTCLHKIYFKDYRFSEDLDFVVNGGYGADSALSGIIGLIENMKSSVPVRLISVNKDKGRIQVFIGYNIVPEIGGTEKKLKLDVCETDEIPAFQERNIMFMHKEFRNENSVINGCTPEAIAADKISRTIGLNKEARDIYDLKHLFEAGLDIKLLKSEFRKVNAYDINAGNLISNIRGRDMKKMWENRLKHQIKDLPDFDGFTAELETTIRDFFGRGA